MEKLDTQDPGAQSHFKTERGRRRQLLEYLDRRHRENFRLDPGHEYLRPDFIEMIEERLLTSEMLENLPRSSTLSPTPNLNSHDCRDFSIGGHPDPRTRRIRKPRLPRTKKRGTGECRRFGLSRSSFRYERVPL